MESLSHHRKTFRLSHKRGHICISPPLFLTTTERLAQLSIVGLRNSLFFWDGSDEYSVNREFLDSPVSEVLPKLFRDTVMVEIDLANGTDEEIAESLKAALPQWRKVRGIEPDVTEAIPLVMERLRKIINYRLIPLIDILVWSNLHQVRVSEDRLPGSCTRMMMMKNKPA